MGAEKTFKKDERISLNKRIEALFDSGTAIHSHPIKILWLPSEEPMKYPAQVMFSVSSKRFKKAVDRNHIKRKLREAYRRQKARLYEALKKQNNQWIICILYTGNDPDPHIETLADKLEQGFNLMIRP
jgi:ribonuclease P protein component